MIDSAFPIDPPLPPTLKSLLIVGGTFDPPHRAHVDLPSRAAIRIGCDHLLYIPAAQSPHKPGQHHAPAHDRLEMLRLVLDEIPNASLSSYELDAEPPSFTVRTLLALRRVLPKDVEMRLLIGSDQLRRFHEWRDVDRVIELAPPAVMIRPPDEEDGAFIERLALDPIYKNWIVSGLSRHDLSATQVRALVQNRQAPELDDSMVHPDVRAYIESHALYGHGGSGE